MIKDSDIDDCDKEQNDFERELEEYNKECEEFQNYIDSSNAEMDNVFDWLELLSDLHDSAERFESNMSSLDKAIKAARDYKHNNFLYGTFHSGIISCYEGFIHEFFDICCQKDEFIKRATSNIQNLPANDLKNLRINKNKEISEDDLRQKLLRATLHNPVQIARISHVLFGLKMPAIRENTASILLEVRNSFTHNNGFSNGKPIELSHKNIIKTHEMVLKLVSIYIIELKQKAENDM